MKRIVITGMGVIAPNGIGKDEFWQALERGDSGIRPATLINTSYFKTKLGAECVDFNAADFLGQKGLRNLDRTARLVCSASKLALEDAGLDVSEENTDDLGIVTATTLSFSGDFAAFTKEETEEGSRFVNPALFPPTTINYPSSQISIRYKIKGFNTTVSTGFSAGLDALKYAVGMIEAGRAKAVLVCGVESFSFSNYVGFYKIGFLAGIKGQEISCPFDTRHNGIVFGEAGAVLIVEDEEYARRRKARIYAEVLSVESFFDAYHIGRYAFRPIGLKQSMVEALNKADLREDDIDYICACANSVPQQDILETQAIKDIFNIYAKAIPVSSIKSMIGESVSASGCLQLIAAVGAINNSFIPPTINYQSSDVDCDLDYVPNVSRKKYLNYVLVDSFGPGSNNSVAIIGKYK